MRNHSRPFKTILSALLLSLALSPAAGPVAAQGSGGGDRSLYQRLGGHDALAAVVDEFIARLAADPQLQRFLTGLSTDSKKRLRQHLLEQFCAATGGPCIYLGRDMKTVHTGLGITEKDWEAGAKDLVAALDKFKVPQREKDEVVAFVASLKKDIVEK